MAGTPDYIFFDNLVGIIAWQKCAGANYQPVVIPSCVFFHWLNRNGFWGVHGMGVG